MDYYEVRDSDQKGSSFSKRQEYGMLLVDFIVEFIIVAMVAGSVVGIVSLVVFS